MAHPAKCPKCSATLAFPESASSDPVRCPVCNARFIIEGRRMAHLAFTDYYALLGVAPNVDDDEVRRAIRAKILEWHPDRNPDDPAAADRLREVIQAKEVLTDPKKCRTYNGLYFAKPLPRWTGAPRRAAYQRAEWRGSPFEPHRGYEDVVAGARERSRAAPDRSVEDLLGDIEEALRRSGVSVHLRKESGAGERAARRPLLGVRASLIGALAGLMIGLFLGLAMGGKAVGVLIIGGLGALGGWFTATYAVELAALALFGLRIAILSPLLGLIAIRIATGGWDPVPFKDVLMLSTVAPLLGATILGLFRIGASVLEGRMMSLLRLLVLGQAAIGAWGGALVVLPIIFYRSADLEGAVATAGWWFLFFTLYLFIDVQIFARPKIVVFGDRR